MSKFLAYNPQLKEKANTLRKNTTPAESLLWGALRKRQIQGIQFNRQKMIGNYIVDFYCKELQLAIEVDDQSHTVKYEYDQQRTMILNTLGITVLRFTNEEVVKNLEGVVMTIKEYIQREKPTP